MEKRVASVAKIENPSPGTGEDDLHEGDDARSKSLQLGGTGPNFGKVFGKYAIFLGEVREELRKVSWPTRKVVVTETVVVVVFCIFFTALITGLDWFMAL